MSNAVLVISKIPDTYPPEAEIWQKVLPVREIRKEINQIYFPKTVIVQLLKISIDFSNLRAPIMVAFAEKFLPRSVPIALFSFFRLVCQPE